MTIMKISGIYCIENIINGKKYIGSSIRCKDRIRSHRSYLNRNAHQNLHLQKAWNKYGASNFKIYIIRTCDPKDLDSNEIALIHINRSNDRNFGYNLDGGGVGRSRIVSPETRAKISKFKRDIGAWKGSKNPGYGKSFVGSVHPCLGKHLDKETIEKISNSLKTLFKDKTKNPMYGRHHSEITKKIISESRKKYVGKKHPMYGKKHKKSSLIKMSKSHCGKIASKATRRKMSLSRKGKRFSEKHKKHLSESLKKTALRGKNHPRYGKHPSKKTRMKMSAAKKLS